MNPSVAAKTSPAINPDRTSSSKEHFEVLDGLRGISDCHLSPLQLFVCWDTPLGLAAIASMFLVSNYTDCAGFVGYGGQ
jgi:hypothetical protein